MTGDAVVGACAVVAAALIAAVPIVMQVRRMDRRNSHQHADNGRVLGRIEDNQTQLLTLLTDHITDGDAHGR